MRRLIDTPDIVKLKYCAISVGMIISFSLSSNIIYLLLSSESAFQGETRIHYLYLDSYRTIEIFKYMCLLEYTMSGEDELENQKMEIRKTIVIDASPEVVFNAITEPEELTRWFPDQEILEPKIGFILNGN